jgi:hypothetical protein
VLIFTLIKKELGFPHINTEELNVPSSTFFEPSFSCCDASCTTFFPGDCVDQQDAPSWIANFGGRNGKGWVPFVAAGPGILAFLLCVLNILTNSRGIC